MKRASSVAPAHKIDGCTAQGVVQLLAASPRKAVVVAAVGCVEGKRADVAIGEQTAGAQLVGQGGCAAAADANKPSDRAEKKETRRRFHGSYCADVSRFVP